MGGGGKGLGADPGTSGTPQLLPAGLATELGPQQNSFIAQLGQALQGFGAQSPSPEGRTTITSPGNPTSPTAPQRPLSFSLPVGSGGGKPLGSRGGK